MNGSLTFDDYKKLIKNKEVISKNHNGSRIQPSSMDLTLSNECYELKYSFDEDTGTVTTSPCLFKIHSSRARMPVVAKHEESTFWAAARSLYNFV